MRKLLLSILAVLLVLTGLPLGIGTAQANELTTQQKFEVLKQKGIFTGFSDGSARLDESMSREQFAAVLFRLWELQKDSSSPSYDDVLKTRWSFGEIQAVTKAGLLKGLGNRKFGPTDQVTVEQLAVVLVRAYNLTGKGSKTVTGKVSEWARNDVSLALDKGFIPVRSDYTVPATRGLLVDAAYAVHMEMSPLSIKQVWTVSSYTLWVELHQAVSQIDKARISIKDSSGNSLKVNSAELINNGTHIQIGTEFQNPGTSYSLYVDGKSNWSFNGYYNPPPSDTTKPVISSHSRLGNGVIELTFSEQVDQASATRTDNYSINNGLAVRSVRLSDDKRKVTITTGTQTSGTTYKLTVKGVKDLAGNVMDTRNDISFTGSNDQTKPTVKSVKSETGRTILVVFSEKVNKDTAEHTGNYSINNGLSVTSAALGSDGITVTLYTSAQKDGTLYTLTVQNVRDLAGNVMDKRSNLQFGGIEDKTKPTVKSVKVNSNATVTVVFSEKITSQTAQHLNNYTINNGLNVTKAQLEPDGVTVTLWTTSQKDATVYTLTINGVTDLSGNVMNKQEAVFGGVIDRTPPTITSVTSTGADKVVVTFSERLDRATAENRSHYSIDGGLGTPSAAVYDDSKRTVTLTTASQKAGQIYNLTINSVKDLGGQTIEANTRAAFVGVSPATAGTVIFEAVRTINTNTIELTFSKGLSQGELSGLKASIIADNGSSISMSGWKWYNQQVDGNDRKVTVQYRTDSSANPTLFKPGRVYTVQVTGLAGLSGDNNANRKTLAGTENSNEIPYVTKVQALNNSLLKISFNEPVKNVAASSFRIVTQDGGQTIEIASALISGTGEIVSDVELNLKNKLQAGKVYHLFVQGGITDAAGWNGIQTKDGSNAFKIAFAGTDSENAAPRLTEVTAKDRYTLEVQFSEPVRGADSTVYELYNVTDNQTIAIRRGQEAVYRVSENRRTLTIYMSVDSGSRLHAGKTYKLTANTDNGTLTDDQGKRMETSNSSATFAGSDNGNARPSIAQIHASGTTISITFSETVTGYNKQTDFFKIEVDGKTIQPTSGSMDGRTIKLTVPRMTSGKLGRLMISSAGEAALRDYNKQSPASEWVSFGVQ